MQQYQKNLTQVLAREGKQNHWQSHHLPCPLKKIRVKWQEVKWYRYIKCMVYSPFCLSHRMQSAVVKPFLNKNPCEFNHMEILAHTSNTILTHFHGAIKPKS
jgi:hypothetical protein